MKTIRIEYLTKVDRNTDLTKWFTGLNAKDPAAANNHHVHFVDDTTVDILVPDNFNPATILGTVIKPDQVVKPHIFAGHENTLAIVDKTGKIELPIPIPSSIPPEENVE